jgi:hypothetical protein
MIFWFSPNIYGNVWEALKLLDGFRWDDTPLSGCVVRMRALPPTPNADPAAAMRWLSLAGVATAKLVKTKANIFQAPTEREVHPHEKNEAMLRHFLEMVVDSGTLFLIPPAGPVVLSSSTRLGATVLGLEADESYAAAARRAFANSSTGVGSDAETVYLTLWQEGHRPLIKQLTHKEAIALAFSIIKAATEWNR